MLFPITKLIILIASIWIILFEYTILVLVLFLVKKIIRSALSRSLFFCPVLFILLFSYVLLTAFDEMFLLFVEFIVLISSKKSLITLYLLLHWFFYNIVIFTKSLSTLHGNKFLRIDLFHYDFLILLKNPASLCL